MLTFVAIDIYMNVLAANLHLENHYQILPACSIDEEGEIEFVCEREREINR